MTEEGKAYLEKYKPKLLCGYGDSALYQTQWGARTVADALEMQGVQRAYFAKIADQRARPKVKPIVVSDELMRSHLRCVDDYGCGLFDGEGY